MFCGACNIGRKNNNNSKNGGKGRVTLLKCSYIICHVVKALI